MSYLQTSTHFNNWVFSEEELRHVNRLRHLKAKRALREEQETLAAAAAAASDNGAVLKPTRKARSFAALVPVSSTATQDTSDWNDDVDAASLETQEEQEEKAGLRLTPLLEYLTLEQERMLREFYEIKVQESCTQLFRTSDKVKCCALMLFKRFYLSNSVMEFHPKFIVPTAIYVAGKVEEQYISVDTVAEQLHVDHKHVIGHEMILLEGVRFQLIMYHPFRALLGFVDDFRGFSKSQDQDLPLDVLQKLHANASAVVNEMLLTELPLRHYPASLALAALGVVADEMEKDPAASKLVTRARISEYISRSKFAQGKALDHTYDQLAAIQRRYEALKQEQRTRQQDPVVAEKHSKEIKKLYKKLKKFDVDGDESSSKKKEDKKRKANGEGASGSSKKEDSKKKSKKHKKEKKEKTASTLVK